MKTYYSAATGGFYNQAIHGTKIPAGAVEVAQDEYQALLAGQSGGQCITADSTGRPVLIAPPEPTTQERASLARAKRDQLLSDTDWVTLKALDSGQPVPQAWLDYRQALRDITAQASFPADIDWPQQPV